MRFATLLPIAALAAVVAAAPNALEERSTGSTSQCNTGTQQCCASTTSPTDPTTSTLLGLLGISVGSLTGLVGLNCVPISVIGVASGNSCTQQPVCCTGNSYSGIVVVGCSPISL